MDIDSKEALLSHKNTIKIKSFLNKLYSDFYKQFKKAKFPRGKIVEIGSGGGFIKEIIPKTITSDVIEGSGIDKVFSATKMPFPNESISGFLMVDVLHHIKDPEKALREMYRILKPSGKVLMIEPYNSILSYVIYKYIHPEKEGFNPNAGWKIPGKGRMSAANPAIPWIILIRDREIFEERFPGFKITKTLPHTPFKYIISGGLSKYQLLPTSFYEIIDIVEKKLSFLNEYIAMLMTVELKKNEKREKLK